MNMPTARPLPEVPNLLEALGSYGVDGAGLTAIRAFARVVSKGELARTFAEFLELAEAPQTADAEVAGAEAAFCAELLATDRWHALEKWFEGVFASWSRCVEAGSECRFAWQSCATLVRAASAQLAGGRAVVYQLELDILFALDGLAWCVASLLSQAVLQREAELRRMASEWDPLTGLPNRRSYQRMLDDWLLQAGPASRVGLVILSVEWGIGVQHLPLSERDRLRLAIADRLREAVRPGDLLCVTGDHEWSLLLPALRSPAQVRLAANKLISACEALLDGEFREMCGRLRAGGAVGPESGKDPAQLEYAARTALLVARQSDLHFEDYRAEFAGVVNSVVEFERDLLDALHQQEMQLFLQPQVRLDDGSCQGAELLLRWRRSNGEWVPPPAIIDGALRLGVLPQLSRWLIMHGAQIASRLANAGIAARVNLNITAFDLKDEELPELVTQALDFWRVEPHRFGLEVTETALVADQDRAARLIGRLRALGCPVALDDFGTGFSSLAYLRNLPVTELKIDQMFVRQLGNSAADQAIVESIMRLADGFGVQVVAEGVEDARARELLHAAGCDLMQGFLESAAMPYDEFVEWWRLRQDRGHLPGDGA